MRWFRVLTMLFAISLSTFVAVVIGSSPAQADPGACPPNSTDTGTSVGVRCINGVLLITRGRINQACFNTATVMTFERVYTRRECGGNGAGVEYIAQSRAVGKMDVWRGVTLGTGINPDVQWEVGILGKRTDILWYDHTKTTQTDVFVLEAKQSTSSDFDDWSSQLTDRYINPLINTYKMPSVHPGVLQDDIGHPYWLFEVERGCWSLVS
jgi:hypothetical protein